MARDTRNLLGGADGTELRVGRDGQIDSYAPVAGGMGAGESIVLDLVRREQANGSQPAIRER
jgi:hypothetical protein